MLIIVIEILMYILLSKRLLKKRLFNYKLLIFTLFIQLLILICYRIELTTLGREVYYSDAYNYWEQTKLLLADINNYSLIDKITGGQTFYVLFCYLIQKTSLFQSPILLNLSNLLLLNNTIFIFAYLLDKINIRASTIKFYLFFLLNNPLIIYSLIRNMKDALILFLTVLLVLFFIRFIENKNKIYIVYIGIYYTYLLK